MHDEPKIAREVLRACLEEQYGVIATAIQFLPVGADTRAGVYRVESEQGDRYFLKIKSGSLYTASYLISRHLHDLNITSVVAPVPTLDETLWTRAGEWNILLYPFIDGDTGWDSITSEQWTETGRIFKQIHAAALPASGFDGLRKESFDPMFYVEAVEALEGELAGSRGTEGSRGALEALWTRYHPTINELLGSLRKLGPVLQARSLPRVICHADLHPGNLLRDGAGRVFVVDWDDVILAPRERDFIFTGEPAGDWIDGSPFFGGYGNVEVDWTAVTYYRYERVVQDFIVEAQNVLREDLSEETKANSLAMFRASFEGRNAPPHQQHRAANLEAARVAAKRMPAQHG